MIDGPAAVPPPDAASAEAAAEHLMTLHHLQQQADTRAIAQDRGVARMLVVAMGLLLGAACGGAMGLLRGHVIAGALLLGLVGALLALIVSRPR